MAETPKYFDIKSNIFTFQSVPQSEWLSAKEMTVLVEALESQPHLYGKTVKILDKMDETVRVGSEIIALYSYANSPVVLKAIIEELERLVFYRAGDIYTSYEYSRMNHSHFEGNWIVHDGYTPYIADSVMARFMFLIKEFRKDFVLMERRLKSAPVVLSMVAAGVLRRADYVSKKTYNMRDKYPPIFTAISKASTLLIKLEPIIKAQADSRQMENELRDTIIEHSWDLGKKLKVILAQAT